jgi:hypothetical protein
MAQMAFPGGARLRAEPGAELRLLSSSQPLILAGGRRVAGYTVMVRAGNVDVEIIDRESSSSAVILVLPRRLNVIVQSGAARAVASSDLGAVAVVSGQTIASVGGGPPADRAGLGRNKRSQRACAP